MSKLILFLFLSVWTISLSAQNITRGQADTIVKEYLLSQMVEYGILHVNISEPNAEGIAITTLNDETTFKAKYACWSYYLKESEPPQCRFLFVKADNGNLLEVISINDHGLSDLTQWKALDDDDPVGLLEKEESAIRPIIYPNPVDNWLNLQGIGERTRVEIHDVKGTCLFSEFLTGEKANQLDVSFLNAGIYLVSVYGETRVVYKIVKN